MSATGEVEKTDAEQPLAEAPATEKPAEKPVKEKKPKKKPKAPKTAAHPPYFEMITEALVALNEKSGSSPYAIAKFMEEKHEAVLPANFRKILALQLKNSAAKGKLIKVKASYKLSEEKNATATVKKPKPSKANAEKKIPAAAPKSPGKTRAATKKTEAATKKPAKKAKKAAAPAKAKQPKSIKSPAAKRAKRAAAA